MEHKPGRATDALVHRALWPEQRITHESPGTPECGDKRYWVAWPLVGGPGLEVPHYTTSLIAWDWERDGWGWKAEDIMQDHVEVSLFPADDAPIYELAFLSDNGGNAFRAQAFARALCVLAWAERRGE